MSRYKHNETLTLHTVNLNLLWKSYEMHKVLKKSVIFLGFRESCKRNFEFDNQSPQLSTEHTRCSHNDFGFV